jgi:hypothetical protein
VGLAKDRTSSVYEMSARAPGPGGFCSQVLDLGHQTSHLGGSDLGKLGGSLCMRLGPGELSLRSCTKSVELCAVAKSEDLA